MSQYLTCTVALVPTPEEDRVEVVGYFFPTLFCHLILFLTDRSPDTSSWFPVSPYFSLFRIYFCLCDLALHTHGVVQRKCLIHYLESTCMWRHMLDSSLKSQFSGQITGTILVRWVHLKITVFFLRLPILYCSPYKLLRSLDRVVLYFPPFVLFFQMLRQPCTFPNALDFLTHFTKLPSYLPFCWLSC